MWEEKYGETKLSRFSFWSNESSDPIPGNDESMTRGRIRRATERETTDLPPTSRPKLKPVVSDTMKEMNRRLDFLIEKYDRMERFDKEEKGVRLNFSSISNCLPDYGSRMEVVENNNAKWQICSFEETLASVSKKWGMASSSAYQFPLSSLDGYSSGDDESSDPSSGNDEPMTRGRDRQESADMIGPVDVDMQSALSNSCISSPSPAVLTANKKSVSSECVLRSDTVPGIGESKTRGRVRRKKAKKVARPRPRPPLNGFNLSLKSVKRPINRLRGRRKIMAAHHYRLKPGENSASSLWLKQKQPKHHSKIKGRKKVMVAHQYWLKPSSLWLKQKQPKHHSKIKGRKKVMVAHQYWLKPGEDMTCPLWLKHQPKYTCSHRASFDLCWPKDPSIIVAHI